MMNDADGLHRDSRIYVAGHTGLAGSAIVRRLRAQGCTNLIMATHAELDLTRAVEVDAFFSTKKPDVVFVCAARVGGIMANDSRPAEFAYDNLLIEANIIAAARRASVQRLLFLGSSCVYPRDCPQPIREEYLLTGPLEPTNRSYAIAKIAGIELCWAYNRQYGTEYVAAMPANLYGPHDNFDLDTGHAFAAVIRRTHEAMVRGDRTVTLWGTGTPRREFLHSDDLADACVLVMSSFERARPLLVVPNQPPIFNVGCGNDLSIRELASLVAEVVGYSGSVSWDTSKPDGAPRKLLDISRLGVLGWSPRVELREGIAQAYQDFLQRQHE